MNSLEVWERACVLCFTWMEWLWVGNLDNDVGILLRAAFLICFICLRFEILIIYEWTESE